MISWSAGQLCRKASSLYMWCMYRHRCTRVSGISKSAKYLPATLMCCSRGINSQSKQHMVSPVRKRVPLRPKCSSILRRWAIREEDLGSLSLSFAFSNSSLSFCETNRHVISRLAREKGIIQQHCFLISFTLGWIDQHSRWTSSPQEWPLPYPVQTDCVRQGCSS